MALRELLTPPSFPIRIADSQQKLCAFSLQSSEHCGNELEGTCLQVPAVMGISSPSEGNREVSGTTP